MGRTLSGAREIGASNITSYRTVNLIVLKYITSSSNVYYVVPFSCYCYVLTLVFNCAELL